MPLLVEGAGRMGRFPASEWGTSWLCVRSDATLLSSLGRALLYVLCFAPAPSLLKADDRQTTAEAVSDKPARRPRRRLNRIVARRALEFALSELGAGATLVWQRPGRGLVGRVRPVSAFRRRQRPRLPYRRLFAHTRRLISGKSRRCLPGARRLLVARGIFRPSLGMFNVSGTVVAFAAFPERPRRGEKRRVEQPRSRFKIHAPSLARRNVDRLDAKGAKRRGPSRPSASRLGPRLEAASNDRPMFSARSVSLRPAKSLPARPPRVL